MHDQTYIYLPLDLPRNLDDIHVIIIVKLNFSKNFINSRFFLSQWINIVWVIIFMTTAYNIVIWWWVLRTLFFFNTYSIIHSLSLMERNRLAFDTLETVLIWNGVIRHMIIILIAEVLFILSWSNTCCGVLEPVYYIIFCEKDQFLKFYLFRRIFKKK